MSDYIVEMKNITKKFPKIIANDNVSISIKEGEIYALLGENGAGKSTLMSVLFGMYYPDKGEIFIRGKKEKISSPSYATKLGIGMVHQHFKLVNNYTITENIIMGEEPIKKRFLLFPYVDMKSANDKVASISKKYGLEVNPYDKIEDVLVSTRQRVEILKMLYREADILIFDEPTAVLTPQEIDFFLEILRNLQKSGKTIILISHKLDEIKKVANRCAIMKNGKLVGVYNVSEIDTKQMAHHMVGKDVSFVSNKRDKNFGDVCLKVDNLVVSDGDLEKVKNVSFSVRRGEILAVAGVSDNGQIELIQSITGMIKAKSGKITLNGEDITSDFIRDRLLRGISYIPEDRQNVGLVLDFTMAENIVLHKYYTDEFCKSGLLDKPCFDNYCDTLIDSFDIRSSAGSKTIVRDMSGGNQQKVIVAREIDLGNDLMIFVQPTRGLDIGAIENIHTKILEQRQKGKAIILVSLELEEVMNLADTIAVMYNGEIVKIESADRLNRLEIGEYMMGVKTS